jgi:hypothetical protein
MTESTKSMTWSVERRLEFVEFRIFWDGQIRRGDLGLKFGISTQQASMDLNRYQEMAAGNLTYDKSKKAYVSTPQFEPQFYDPSASDYLTDLRLIADGIRTKEDAWHGWLPNFETVPLPRRRASPLMLRQILQSIREQQAINIRYQSMSRDKPIWRWITPHALGFDGYRWHTRSWCHRDETFKDFVLARILNFKDCKEHVINPADDREWQEPIVMEIGPHPKLKEGARKAIELDYGMTSGKLKIECRLRLSWYVERHLGLDLDPSVMRPERQQIVLLNRKEIEETRLRIASIGQSISNVDEVDCS